MDASEYAKSLQKLIKELRSLARIAPASSQLRNSEKFLLFMIGEVPSGIKPSEIARELDITLGAVTQQINSLKEHDLVIITPNTADKRSISVSLSKKGKKLLVQLKEENTKKLAGLITYLGENDSKEFLYLLTKVCDYMRAQKGV